MKHIHGAKTRRSFNSSYRLNMLILTIIIALALIGFQVSYETVTANARIAKETAQYEEHIKNRIKEEVEIAVVIANFHYDYHSADESSEEVEQHIWGVLETIQSSDVGYFFAADYEGNDLMGPCKGNNVYNIEDKNGKKVVQELIAAAQRGGGYVEYTMPPLEGVEQVPKISYVLPFEPYNCYIGAGVNLYEIETIKEQIRAESIRETIQTLIMMGALFAFLMVLFNRFNSRLYRKIDREVGLIKNYLEVSANGQAELDVNSFQFLEMEQIGRHTASLIEKRNESRSVLSSQYNLIKEAANQLAETNASLEEEIVEHARALELLGESQKRMELIVQTLPDIIFIMDRNGTFLDCEAGNTTWMRMKKEDFVGKTVREILPEDIAASCIAQIGEALRTGRMQTRDYKIEKKDSFNYYEVRMITFQKEQVFTIVRNVTEVKKVQLNNEYLSYHDQLTGLYNRRYFEEALIRLDQSNYLPIAVVMVDVNGLKLTNDAFGHQTGDKLLCLIAGILKRHCTLAKDLVARIGGDEFVIVCPNTGQSQLERMVSQIYRSIEQERKEHSILSISIGWEIRTSDGQSMTEIFNKAEEYMYRKKLAESQSIRNQTVQAIMKTLNEKNVREKIHSERVSAISKLIGEAMGLDYGTVKELETAGLLHDIGKIAVDENILSKEGKLTREEYEKVKKHPESSYQILKSINAYAALADDVLSHHERWDGGGYPRRLKGEEISLIARIICVADAFEAMTADRSYRAAMTKEAALAELKRCAGTQFDPQIIEVFEKKVFAQL